MELLSGNVETANNCIPLYIFAAVGSRKHAHSCAGGVLCVCASAMGASRPVNAAFLKAAKDSIWEQGLSMK